MQEKNFVIELFKCVCDIGKLERKGHQPTYIGNCTVNQFFGHVTFVLVIPSMIVVYSHITVWCYK